MSEIFNKEVVFEFFKLLGGILLVGGSIVGAAYLLIFAPVWLIGVLIGIAMLSLLYLLAVAEVHERNDR